MNNKLINDFVDNINALSCDNIDAVLSQIYTDEVEFIDPVKGIKGLQALRAYFAHLYKNVNQCHFTISQHICDGPTHAIAWVMTLNHQRLARHKDITVQGASFIKFADNKACYQRDYYDLGALIYERLPVVGTVIKTVRNAL